MQYIVFNSTQGNIVIYILVAGGCQQRCLNGGHCEGEQCKCKEGYVGRNCQQRKHTILCFFHLFMVRTKNVQECKCRQRREIEALYIFCAAIVYYNFRCITWIHPVTI